MSSIWPAFHNKMAWAAGVIDGAGTLYLRYHKKTGEAYAAEVRVVGRELLTPNHLQEILGGNITDNTWTCPAGEQRETLTNLMPFLRCEACRYWAGEILKFRVTQSVAVPGVKLTPAMKAYRKSLGKEA